MAERSILQAYLGVWGPLQEKGPQGPSFLRPLGGKRPPRWGGGPAGARGGPSYLFTGSLRRNPPLAASNRRGSKFPAGEIRWPPLPTLPPRGEAGWWKPRGQRPPLLGSPFKGSCRRRRLRGPFRPLPPSIGELPSNPVPSAAQQPKGGGRLVSTHAALSPELGSSLKARSGCKSRTTAPGVQGAGRGPRRFLWLLSCPRKKVTRLSGRDPTTPPAGCRETPGGETPQTPPPPNSSSLKAAAAWYPPTPHSALS